MTIKKYMVCFKHTEGNEIKEFRINSSHVEELEIRVLESLNSQGFDNVNILAIQESQYITTSQL